MLSLAVRDRFVKTQLLSPRLAERKELETEHENNRHGPASDKRLGSPRQYGKHSIEPMGSNNEREAESDNQMSEAINTVKATQQVCVDQWPTLFADGKTEIRFDDGDTWSFSNEIKGLIEDFIGAPVDWWPLNARRRPLQDGFSRVTWKCVSRASPELTKRFSNRGFIVALRKEHVGYYVNGS